MSLLTINGIHLNVVTKREGYPVILIHGVGQDHTFMDNIAIPLSENFQTISFDCRGHGQSDKPAHFTLQDHINDVVGILNHYGIKQADLIGVSMGSYIAQGVAIAVPGRIKKLVLTVTKSNGLTSSVQRLFKEHAEEIKGLNLHQSIEKLLKYMVYDADFMHKHLDVFDTRLTPEQFATANKAMQGFDFRNEYSKITAEALVISGKHDGLNPPAEGREVANAIKDAEFVEMQYSGHAPPYEEPEAYIEFVRNFLREE